MADNLCRPGAARYSRPKLSVVRTFAETAGIRRSTAAQLISGNSNLIDRVVKLICACRTSRDPEMLERILKPIREAAGENGPVEPYSEALELAVQRSDGREEESKLLYELHPSRETAEARVRALESDVARKACLRDALIRKWGL